MLMLFEVNRQLLWVLPTVLLLSPAVACSTVTVNKCQAALRTLQGFPYFQPTCLCREPHVDPECNTFHEFFFDHPCTTVDISSACWELRFSVQNFFASFSLNKILNTSLEVKKKHSLDIAIWESLNYDVFCVKEENNKSVVNILKSTLKISKLS